MVHCYECHEYDEKLIHSQYFNHGIFINNPSPVDGQGQAHVSFMYQREEATSNGIEYSIVIPVYNQQQIIVDNVSSAIEMMGGKDAFEVIIICDGCDDGTELKVTDFFKNYASMYERLDRAVVVHQPTPIFETACDNMGFLLSRGNYVLEVQADMKVLTYNYNEILRMPFRLQHIPEVCGVSGRCCHAWRGSVGFGMLGADFGTPGLIPPNWKYKFFIADTCNRGPLLLDRKKLIELQYLDQQNFYLDDSDHDYFARARYLKGWICGYVPIDVYAPLQLGSNRKARNEENERVLKFLKKRSNGGYLKNNKLEDTKHIDVVDLTPYISYV